MLRNDRQRFLYAVVERLKLRDFQNRKDLRNVKILEDVKILEEAESSFGMEDNLGKVKCGRDFELDSESCKLLEESSLETRAIILMRIKF